MSKSWPTTKLGEVLRRVKDEVLVQDANTYARLTIRMNGKGIALRDRVPGHEIGTKRQFLARTGQLVLSKIDARNGAFGILPPECDNAIITGNFWAFDADPSRLLPTYFDYLTKTPLLVEFCVRASEGTTNRLYLQEGAFLAQEIFLPPLAEQRRIVARIEKPAAKIEEAKALRRQAAEEAAALPGTSADAIFQTIKNCVRLGEGLFDLIYRYPTFYNIEFVDGGVGLLKISNITQNGWSIQFENPRDFISLETSKRFPRTILEAGDIVMAARGATIGKTAYVTEEFAGFNINANLLRLKPNASKLDGKYLWHFMRSNLGQSQFQKLVTSTAKQTITVPKLKSILIPLPSVAEQRRVVAELDALQAELDALKRLQAETAAELDALLPSILDKAFKGEL